jgi:hypothetical protein
MTKAGNAAKSEAVAKYTAGLPSDFSQTLRCPLTKALVNYYSPPEDMPSKFFDSLAELNKQ